MIALIVATIMLTGMMCVLADSLAIYALPLMLRVAKLSSRTRAAVLVHS